MQRVVLLLALAAVAWAQSGEFAGEVAHDAAAVGDLDSALATQTSLVGDVKGMLKDPTGNLAPADGESGVSALLTPGATGDMNMGAQDAMADGAANGMPMSAANVPLPAGAAADPAAALQAMIATDEKAEAKQKAAAAVEAKQQAAKAAQAKKEATDPSPWLDKELAKKGSGHAAKLGKKALGLVHRAMQRALHQYHSNEMMAHRRDADGDEEDEHDENENENDEDEDEDEDEEEDEHDESASAFLGTKSKSQSRLGFGTMAARGVHHAEAEQDEEEQAEHEAANTLDEVDADDDDDEEDEAAEDVTRGWHLHGRQEEPGATEMLRDTDVLAQFWAEVPPVSKKNVTRKAREMFGKWIHWFKRRFLMDPLSVDNRIYYAKNKKDSESLRNPVENAQKAPGIDTKPQTEQEEEQQEHLDPERPDSWVTEVRVKREPQDHGALTPEPGMPPAAFVDHEMGKPDEQGSLPHSKAKGEPDWRYASDGADGSGDHGVWREATGLGAPGFVPPQDEDEMAIHHETTPMDNDPVVTPQHADHWRRATSLFTTLPPPPPDTPTEPVAVMDAHDMVQNGGEFGGLQEWERKTGLEHTAGDNARSNVRRAEQINDPVRTVDLGDELSKK